MSYNVKAFDWSIKLKAETSPIIQYIKENDPDIVCLQEFMSADRSKDRNIKAIRQVLDQYPYFSVTDLWPSMQGYTYGLACFSKYPIISTEQIPLDSEVNGAVVYKIKVNGKIIHIINNHLESNRLTAVDKKLYQDLLKDANRQSIDNAMHNIKDKLGSAFQKRAPQADIISNWVKKWGYDTPIIVCGDFNDTPISYTYRKIKNNLVDSYASTGFGPGITYHENHFWFRIDFIMHSENIKSYNTTIGKIKYSDHYPIWSYIQLP
ncbi:endonuclease/exonuclease/phosphatase family protein [Dysgonomonas sp. 216]|uniref:endonuclease/exonuclease/phosphatase family protein n=1 Tax=Dysgonomonas sp. 216 TaxID=2302934 RepID=UPI0013D62DA2|nr:endonuclease/exonuclease/phosphatase family protein [Dysgonomonas sp. 216]